MIKSRIFVATEKKSLLLSRLAGWLPEERLVFRKSATISCSNNDPTLSRCTNNHDLMIIMYMFKCSDKLDALVNYLMQACLIRPRCFISYMRCWMWRKHVGTKTLVARTLNQHNHVKCPPKCFYQKRRESLCDWLLTRPCWAEGVTASTAAGLCSPDVWGRTRADVFDW